MKHPVFNCGIPDVNYQVHKKNSALKHCSKINQFQLTGRDVLESEQSRVIIKQRGMMLVEFPEYFGNDGLPHEFRLVPDPELPAVLIDSL